MKNKHLKIVMSSLGKSKSPAKIEAAMVNLKKANRAKMLVKQMAKRRGCKCSELKTVLKKQGIIKK